MAEVQRRNEAVLGWVRALAIAALSGFALAGMHVEPVWLVPVLVIAIAALALASTELAVLLAVCALSVPVIAIQPVVGFAMLIVLIASVRYLGGDGAHGFIVLGASIAGAFLGPVWVGAALAGYVLGAGEGALAAGIACVAVEVTGIALGRASIGTIVTGGPTRAIVSFAHAPKTLLSGAWVAHSVTSLNGATVGHLVSGISHITSPVMLLVQPILWVCGAALAGVVARRSDWAHGMWSALASVAVGVLVPAAGGALLGQAFGAVAAIGPLSIAVAESLALAGGFVLAWEQLFALERTEPISAEVKRVSMATEDADVDELLRLIATAEDKLATQHTSTRVVLITDMKSFSRMTEEDGSVATAKAIQRHRDLLVPIIERHNGSGKSTGGDGLVAAFESPSDALTAAVEMQRALAAHSAAHADIREIGVRAGLARGEVVLDKGGRPFIGAGLNLAARVMNLADGGQVFAAADVARAAAGVGIATHSFGEFQLKNIAKPIEIVELLYIDGQVPRDPRELGSAAPTEGA